MTKRKPIEDHLPSGRPTKWKPELNVSIVDYFMGEHTREVEVVKRGKDGSEYITYEERANTIPTFEGWCAKCDIDEDLPSTWGHPDNVHKYPGFIGAYKKAKRLQHDWVVANAMTGKFNPAFSIFFAKNNMGMRDKTETEVTLNVADDLDSLDIQKKRVSDQAKKLLNGK